MSHLGTSASGKGAESEGSGFPHVSDRMVLVVMVQLYNSQSLEWG
jgi:hypothetical protein